MHLTKITEDKVIQNLLKILLLNQKVTSPHLFPYTDKLAGSVDYTDCTSSER